MIHDVMSDRLKSKCVAAAMAMQMLGPGGERTREDQANKVRMICAHSWARSGGHGARG